MLFDFFVLSFVSLLVGTLGGLFLNSYAGNGGTLLNSWALLGAILTLLFFCLMSFELRGFLNAQSLSYLWCSEYNGYMGLLVYFGGWGLWQQAVFYSCLLPAIVFFGYTLINHQNATAPTLLALLFLLTVGILFTMTTSILLLFLTFELLLLVSLYLLSLTAKSERIGEAVTEMFFWTLFGSLFLFLGFASCLVEGFYTLEDLHNGFTTQGVIGLFFLIGFGVKLPIWPCFSWLLKAHVEASVEFSILLSGVIVKFGALGLFKVFSYSSVGPVNQLLVACSILGLIDAGFRLIGQSDLKRIVALTTVIELNWVGFCLGYGGELLEQLGAYLLVAHSFTTTAEFFIVECIYRSYHSRDYFVLSGLAHSCPMLWSAALVTTLVTIGFPGTSMFTAKLFFFYGLGLASMPIFFFFLVYFILFMPLYFMRIWVPVWFGLASLTVVQDLTAKEGLLFTFTTLGSVLIGLAPTLLLG